MHYQILNAQNFDIIKLNQKFDSYTVTNIKQEFDKLLNKYSGDVLIDMSKVESLDSSGIGVLVYFYKRLNQSNRDLALLNPQGKPKELLKTLRINETINSYSNIHQFIHNKH